MTTIAPGDHTAIPVEECPLVWEGSRYLCHSCGNDQAVTCVHAPDPVLLLLGSDDPVLPRGHFCAPCYRDERWKVTP